MDKNQKIILGATMVMGIFGLVLTVAPSFAALGEAGGKFDGGTELSYFKYEEPDFMKETGGMFGVFGGYTYRTKQNEKFTTFSELFSSNPINTFGVDGRITFGNVDYTSSGTGSIDNINDLIAEIRGTAGLDMPISEFLLTPYLGLGYRYWADDLGGEVSTTGAAGYDRESNYFYLPIGLNLGTTLNNGMDAVFNFEFDVFLDGTQKSHLEDVSSSLSTLENDQDSGYGIRGSVKLTKEVNNLVLMVEPFIRYWSIDNSKIATISCGGVTCAYGYEPKNNSIEAGARVGVWF